jgi:hypothetical protein
MKMTYDTIPYCKPKQFGYSPAMNKTLSTLIARASRETLTTQTYGPSHVLAAGLREIAQAEKAGWSIVRDNRGEHGTGTVVFQIPAKKQFDCYGKTQSEIKAHLKRTRKTRVRELCAKHNTTSYAQAQHLDTLDLCARIQAHLAAKKISS